MTNGSNDISPDQRLAASITMLATQLTLVAEELLAGLFDAAERHELADTLVDMAQDVRPESQ